MNQDIKAIIVNLLKEDLVEGESLEVAKRHLPSIIDGHLQSMTAGDLDAKRVSDIYQKRMTTLRMSGKDFEGLEELLSGLRKTDSSIRIAQLVGPNWNVTVFISSSMEKVVGLIAIAP